MDRINLEEVLKKTFVDVDMLYKAIGENLTTSERNILWKNIDNRSCRNCTNSSCQVSIDEKIGLNELGAPEGSMCVGWNNNTLLGRKLVLGKKY